MNKVQKVRELKRYWSGSMNGMKEHLSLGEREYEIFR